MTPLFSGSGPFAVRPSILIAGMVVVLTATYHLLLSGHWSGIPFLVWFWLFSIFAIATVGLSRHEGSPWSYLFLVPVAFATVAKFIYASPVIQNLGTLIVFISLAFFVYWYSSPKQPLRHLKTLWPMSFVQETLWPFLNIQGFFSSFRVGRNGALIGTGLVLAIPFILVFVSLFSSADPLFKKVFADLFTNIDLGVLVEDLVWDIAIAVLLLGIGWTVFTRSSEQRQPRHTGHGSLHPGTMVLTGFLAPLTLLFLVFIAFQFAYFFGGADFILAQGLTYSEYARSGFFQLLAVAGLAFGICMGIYRTTDMKDALPKWLTLALILETGVVIASAIRRLSLYIDVYGLTLSRWWAMATIIVIALVLSGLFLAALARVRYGQFVKVLCIASLFVSSFLLLVNVDQIIVTHNAARFLSGRTPYLDVSYMVRSLSADAAPALVELVKKDWPNNDPSGSEKLQSEYRLRSGKVYDDSKTYLAAWLRQEGETMQARISKDWRDYIFSYTRALAAIAAL